MDRNRAAALAGLVLLIALAILASVVCPAEMGPRVMDLIALAVPVVLLWLKVDQVQKEVRNGKGNGNGH